MAKSRSHQPSKIVVICGPTAVGKTSLGIKLCKKFNGEIVSADSQQVYRGMDIGTAKEDLTSAGVRCHLVDVIEPDQPFDVAKFKELADEAIAGIAGRGRLPVVVGGTGLYIKILLEGISPAPGRNEDIRRELMDIRERDGQEALYQILKDEDPTAAERLHVNDTSRIVRAVEIKRQTADIRPQKSDCLSLRGGRGPTRQSSPLKLALTVDRAELYSRINERVDQMIERGLVAEVEGLLAKYGPDIQSLKAVGYKEIVSYLKNERNLEEAIELTKQSTRRFAKRQLTWFRGDKNIEWYSPENFEEIEESIRRFI